MVLDNASTINRSSNCNLRWWPQWISQKEILTSKKKWNVDQFLSTETRGCHFYLLIPVFGWTLFAIISDRHFYLRCGKITFFFCVRFYKKCSLDCKKHSILLFLRILRHCKHVRDLIFGFQWCRLFKNDPALNFVYLQAWIFGHVFFLTCCLSSETFYNIQRQPLQTQRKLCFTIHFTCCFVQRNRCNATLYDHWSFS